MERKCTDPLLACRPCNGFGVRVEQPHSLAALRALATLDEPVVVIERVCGLCGGTGKALL